MGWLEAGVIERGRFCQTEEGTPQGGVISPMLLNIALHGMEEAAGVRYLRCDPHGAHMAAGSPVLVRYAVDFVVMCHTRQRAEQIWDQLGEWLAPRGLAFNQDKTHIVQVDEGFDFLGFNIRRYAGKLPIKPSPAAVKRIRQRLAAEVVSCGEPTLKRSFGGSIRSFGAGPPITGAWYRKKCSQLSSTIRLHARSHAEPWSASMSELDQSSPLSRLSSTSNSRRASSKPVRARQSSSSQPADSTLQRKRSWGRVSNRRPGRPRNYEWCKAAIQTRPQYLCQEQAIVEPVFGQTHKARQTRAPARA